MKRIYFEYLEINNEVYQNNRVRIARKPPRYDDYKDFYLWELFNHDFLEDKIKNCLSSNFHQYQFYDSFIITLNDEQFEEISYLFEEKSQLEEDEFGKELFLFKVQIAKARNNPKMWSVEE